MKAKVEAVPVRAGEKYFMILDKAIRQVRVIEIQISLRPSRKRYEISLEVAKHDPIKVNEPQACGYEHNKFYATIDDAIKDNPLIVTRTDVEDYLTACGFEPTYMKTEKSGYTHEVFPMYYWDGLTVQTLERSVNDIDITIRDGCILVNPDIDFERTPKEVRSMNDLYKKRQDCMEANGIKVYMLEDEDE